MVYNAIVACLDPAQSMLIVASISLFSVFFKAFYGECDFKLRSHSNYGRVEFKILFKLQVEKKIRPC